MEDVKGDHRHVGFDWGRSDHSSGRKQVWVWWRWEGSKPSPLRSPLRRWTPSFSSSGPPCGSGDEEVRFSPGARGDDLLSAAEARPLQIPRGSRSTRTRSRSSGPDPDRPPAPPPPPPPPPRARIADGRRPVLAPPPPGRGRPARRRRARWAPRRPRRRPKSAGEDPRRGFLRSTDARDPGGEGTGGRRGTGGGGRGASGRWLQAATGIP